MDLMNSCRRIRPLIGSLAEGELAPAEAIRVARHLPDCTVCRIVAAREQRLARMLEEDLDDLPVGEDFVRTVMATLPDGPPPDADLAARRRTARRGLKLAGLIGLLAASGLQLWQQVAVQGFVARPALPTPSLDQSETILQAIAGLVGFVLMTLEALAGLLGMSGNWAFDAPGLAGAVGLLAAIGGLVLFATATVSTLLLLVARRLVGPVALRS